jgi:hypothetical protein
MFACRLRKIILQKVFLQLHMIMIRNNEWGEIKGSAVSPSLKVIISSCALHLSERQKIQALLPYRILQ